MANLSMSTIQDVLNNVSGNVMNDSALANKLASAIRSTHNDVSDLIPVLINIYSGIISYKDTAQDVNYAGDHYYRIIDNTLRSELIAQLSAIGADGTDTIVVDDETIEGKAFTLTDGVRLLRLFVQKDGEAVYLNDVEFLWFEYQSASNQDSTMILCDYEGSKVFGTDNSFSTFIDKVVTGYATAEEYANILSDASSIAYNSTKETVSTISTSITDRVRQSKFMSQFDIQNLSIAAAGGVSGLIAGFVSMFSSYKDEAEKANTAGQTYFSSDTNIVISNFASGAVLGALGTIVSAVGLVLSAANALLGVVVTALGAIAGFVGKIVLALTTDYEHTGFKIRLNKSDTDLCFSFCLCQNTTSLSDLASYMRENGATVCTYSMEPYYPVICYCSLTYPDADPLLPEYYYVSWECHITACHDVWGYGEHTILSNRYDLTTSNSDVAKLESVTGLSDTTCLQLITGMQAFAPRGNTSAPYLYIVKDSVSNTYMAYGGPLFHIETGLDFTHGLCALPIVRLSNYGHSRPRMTNPDQLAQLSYSELGMNHAAILNNLLGDYDPLLWRRLCSALLILLYRVFYDNMFQEAPAGGYAMFQCLDWHNDESASFQDTVDIPGYSHRIYVAAGDLEKGFRGLISPIMPNDSFSTSYGRLTSESMLTTVIEPNPTFTDALLTSCIKPLFDQIPLYWVGMSKNYASAWRLKTFGYGGSSYGYNNPYKSNYPSGYMTELTRGFASPITRFTIASNVSSANTATLWPKYLAIDIPSLTFSGFLAGLIIDGLLVLASAAVAIGATIGYFKLKNRQAQLQAQAEGKWYAYQDAVEDHPDDASANKQAWKEYKRSRMSCNLLSLVTGDGGLTLGLYDEGSSSNSEGLISRIRGWVTDDENPLTLDTLYYILTGLER